MKTEKTNTYKENRHSAHIDEEAADELWESVLEAIKEAQANGSKIVQTEDGVLFID